MVNSRLGHFSATSLKPLTVHRRPHFSRSYVCILPSSLTRVLPYALAFSARQPVSVSGTVPCTLSLEILSRHLDSYPLRAAVALLVFTPYLSAWICLRASSARVLKPGLPSPGRISPHASSPRKYKRYGNINPFPIDYAFRPRLRGRLTLGKITLTLESFGFRRMGISPIFSLLMPAFSLPLPPANLTVHLHRPTERSPTPEHIKCSSRSFGTTLSPVTLSARDYSTSELLRTL